MRLDQRSEDMTKNPFLTYGYNGPEYFCDRVDETKTLDLTFGKWQPCRLRWHIQWKNNASRQDDRLCCKITFQGDHNVEK